jgi:hypothetical protein
MLLFAIVTDNCNLLMCCQYSYVDRQVEDFTVIENNSFEFCSDNSSAPMLSLFLYFIIAASVCIDMYVLYSMRCFLCMIGGSDSNCSVVWGALLC